MGGNFKPPLISVGFPLREIHTNFGMVNLPQYPGIEQKAEKSISDFRISGHLFINENCHNSRTSHDIDMKFGPVTWQEQHGYVNKKLKMTSCQQTVTSLSCFQFLNNLQPSGGRIPESWSTKLTSSIIVSFHLTKAENRTIKSLT